jgi:dienelactone hydrolase
MNRQLTIDWRGILRISRPLLATAIFSAPAAIAQTLSVVPEERLFLEPGHVELAGALPGGRVIIDSAFVDEAGHSWAARGTYFASPEGRVNTGENASVTGTYTGVDARGLIWSAVPVGSEGIEKCQSAECVPAGAPSMPVIDVMKPVSITYTATYQRGIDSTTTATATGKQTARFAAPGVIREELRGGDLRGVVFRPPGPGPKQPVLVVTGSGGGVNERTAALLASHGFLALALAHFNYDGRPDALAEIPLEYFRGAMEWLQAESGMERIGLSGGSRGGELVLLLGATWPERVGAIMAGVPSNVVWGGCCDADDVARPAWTLGGKPVPFASYGFEGDESFEGASGDIDWRRLYLPAMLDATTGAIPVERIAAPMLIISGEADALWPSSIASYKVEQRLVEAGKSARLKRIDFPGVGHFAAFPVIVTSLLGDMTHSVANASISMGGTPQLNARAAAEGFRAQVAFFRQNLHTPDL